MKCQVRDVSVHYEVRGNGRPLLMLHGNPTDHRSMMGAFEPIFQDREGWQRIYLDLPGMGLTPGAEWIRGTDEMLLVIEDFIEQMMRRQSFVVAGMSYGGYLARGLLKNMPEWLDGLMLLVPAMTADARQRQLPPKTVLVHEPDALTDVSSDMVEPLLRNMVVLTARTVQRVANELAPGLMIADHAFLAEVRKHYSFSFDMDELAVPFEKPVLIVTGRHDNITGYQEAGSLLEQCPRATYAVLDRAGHGVFIEQETLFNVLVSEWLDRVEEYVGATAVSTNGSKQLA
jgi:pimeloyl-ACP methyl ester carboxylesterase